MPRTEALGEIERQIREEKRGQKFDLVLGSGYFLAGLGSVFIGGPSILAFGLFSVGGFAFREAFNRRIRLRSMTMHKDTQYSP